MNKLIFPLLLLFVTYGCTTVRLSQKPSPGIDSKVPNTKESVVYIPFTLDLKSIEKKVDDAVPKGRIYRDKEGCERDEYEVEVFRDNPMKISTSNGKLIFETKLKVKADVSRCDGAWQNDWLCSCCCHGVRTDGHANSDVALKIEVDLKVNENYAIAANTKVDGEIIAGKNIEIWVLGFKVSIPIEDLTGPIRNQLKPVKKELDKEITKQLNDIKLKEELSKVWHDSHKIIPVEGFYLHVRPKNVYFQNIQSEGNKIMLAAGVGVELNLSSEQREIEEKPLPKLTLSQKTGGFFFLNLPTDASFDVISKKLKEEYGGKKFVHGKNWVKIKNIDLYGVSINENANGLLIDFEIKGKISLFKRVAGHIYFTAKPAIDTEKEVAYLDDFKMNSNTSSEIINKEVEFLINKFYYDDISNASVYSYSSDVEELEMLIKEELKSISIENYNLTLSLDRVKVNGIYITQDVLGIDSELNGSIETVKIE
ncbi:MAG: DUF4403 family protein [Bacteroidales bacterium]|nr:DUF4403 family protein [Bacteroidales bacterium]